MVLWADGIQLYQQTKVIVDGSDYVSNSPVKELKADKFNRVCTGPRNRGLHSALYAWKWLNMYKGKLSLWH